MKDKIKIKVEHTVRVNRKDLIRYKKYLSGDIETHSCLFDSAKCITCILLFPKLLKDDSCPDTVYSKQYLIQKINKMLKEG